MLFFLQLANCNGESVKRASLQPLSPWTAICLCNEFWERQWRGERGEEGRGSCEMWQSAMVIWSEFQPFINAILFHALPHSEWLPVSRFLSTPLPLSLSLFRSFHLNRCVLNDVFMFWLKCHQAIEMVINHPIHPFCRFILLLSPLLLPLMVIQQSCFNYWAELHWLSLIAVETELERWKVWKENVNANTVRFGSAWY